MVKFRFLVLLLAITIQPSCLAKARDTQVVIDNNPWQLKGNWQTANTQKTKGVVLLLHKAAGDRTAYTKMATVLADSGYASLRVDLRGHGESINAGRFDPDISRYEDKNDPAVVANFKLIRQGHLDIVAAIQWLRDNHQLKNKPFIIVGASYTGEQMVKASLKTGFADVYVALAPGNFSRDSITRIDPSNKPWLFVRAAKEMSFFDAIFTAIRKGSKAEIWVLPGSGHATDLFQHHTDLEQKLVEWIDKNVTRKQ